MMPSIGFRALRNAYTAVGAEPSAEMSLPVQRTIVSDHLYIEQQLQITCTENNSFRLPVQRTIASDYLYREQ